MYAHGKLLLTGEYFVLDGALALAIPTRYGQSIKSESIPSSQQRIRWSSLTNEGVEWFVADWEWSGNQLQLLQTNDEAIAERLQQILIAITSQKPDNGTSLYGQSHTVQLEFPREWGLGSSSTLISLLAQKTEVNPYRLLADTFGGSGYDVACATAQGAIFYQRGKDEYQPLVEKAGWAPEYTQQVFFAYLGNKQNSRDGIRYYRELGGTQAALVDEVSSLTRAFTQARAYDDAVQVLEEHESFISATLQMDKVKDIRFASFPGVVKSLGAWGGDFVMVLSPWLAPKTMTYFKSKGCPVVLPYDEMIG